MAHAGRILPSLPDVLAEHVLEPLRDLADLRARRPRLRVEIESDRIDIV